MSTADFLHELGHLKRIPRSGWALAGVNPSESVADHSHRVAAVAYVLAMRTGLDAGKCAALAIFHDAAESRLGDAHIVAKRYVDWPRAQERASTAQLQSLPRRLSEHLSELWQEAHDRDTAESKIVRDADLLECLLQAREYAAQGHDVAEWIDSSMAGLTTDAGRELADNIMNTTPYAWRNAD